MINLSLISDILNSRKVILLPKYQKIFDGLGENIKLARKRRKLTAKQVAERAGIHRATLHRVEKGDPTVAIGIYFNVLKVLNLESDFSKIAEDDAFGRKLQDLDLL
jgi:transcriptional regulator with XRE-family HTH domain